MFLNQSLSAMALKEMREIRGIALVALVIYSLLLVNAIAPSSPLNLLSYVPVASSPYEQLPPFVSDGFLFRFHVVSALLAIVLGLWQTQGESVRGTYPFLLHRPVSRRWLIGVKLVVGMLAYLVPAALPLGIYTLWAATPGSHLGPFEWSMTWPAWAGWLAATVLYTGAFLTGIRPGRWYGTRLLPLLAAVMAVVVAAATASTMYQAPLWIAPATVAADAWVIVVILFVARNRDFS